MLMFGTPVENNYAASAKMELLDAAPQASSLETSLKARVSKPERGNSVKLFSCQGCGRAVRHLTDLTEISAPDPTTGDVA
jgi:hypothetical protein